MITSVLGLEGEGKLFASEAGFIISSLYFLPESTEIFNTVELSKPKGLQILYTIFMHS
jgi:hypothetical protein